MPLSKPASCQGCSLYTLGKGFCEPEGTGSLGVLILGEALGENEANDGLPFRPYAESGSVLSRCIRRAGFDREQFTLYNTVNCQPPYNKLEGERYEASAIEHCSRHVASALGQYRPRVILALGNVALRATTGLSGRNRTISSVRGYVLPSPRYGTLVVPSYHPSFINRGAKNLSGVLIHDIQRAVEVAATGCRVDPVEYRTHPTAAEGREYVEFLRQNPLLPVSYDIETAYSGRKTDESELLAEQTAITQIQFAHQPRQGIVFPWVGDYISLAREILALPNPKWHWNGWAFDNPILRAHNCPIAGEQHDLMWAFHHLQPDLPRGLQYVTSFYAGTKMRPWKHLSDSQPEFYGGCDVDSVQRIGDKVFRDLRERGIYRGYDSHIVRLQPILERMCERGLPIDLPAQAEFRRSIVEQSSILDRDIQALVPEELKGRHPKNGFVRAPKELDGLKLGTFFALLPRTEECKCRISPPLGKTGKPVKCKQCKGTGEVKSKTEREKVQVERYYKEIPFSALSSPQLIRYMRFRNHPVPHAFRSESETTGEKELERLWKKTNDPLYKKILEFRKLGKIRSTYVDGWKLGQDGRVHSTFIFAPVTGQLSSRNPNIQNAPKHGQLATAFRKTIAAREGYRIVELDMTGFHALTLGFLAKDPIYMLLSRLGIHDYVAGHLLRLPGVHEWLSYGVEDLAVILSRVKKEHKEVRDKKAKPACHGYGFGLGAQKLYDMNLESFSSKREAQGVLDLLNSLFPKTAQFRTDIKELAHQQSYLLSPAGYIRYFFDVKHWNARRRAWVAGEDAEAAIAFLPANCAFGHMKDAMLRLEEKGMLDRYRLINQVHDSLKFDCPESLVDDCVREVGEEMEQRSTILVDRDVAPLGLACGIEASVGRNWAELEKVYSTPLEKVI